MAKLWKESLRVLAVMAMVMIAGAATQHKVGDDKGWFIGIDYWPWSHNQTFRVGDSILFEYNKEYHDVVQVSKADFDKCESASPLAKWEGGKNVIKLQKEGTFYYLCSVPGHCAKGQKVAVTVKSANAAPAASPAPVPSHSAKSKPKSVASPPTATAVHHNGTALNATASSSHNSHSAAVSSRFAPLVLSLPILATFAFF